MKTTMFQHRLIMTPIASYIGMAALAYCIFLLSSGAVSLWWLLPLVVGTVSLLLGVTVGMHRLFCHNSFKTSKFWHAVLAYLGTLAVYGSTVQWAAMHSTHHKYSDGELDPHYTGFRYLFWKKNRPTLFSARVLIRLYRQQLHRVLYKTYFLVILLTVLILSLIDFKLLIFGYLAPLGWLHFVGSVHQVYAHSKSKPRNMEFLELLLPTGGEWIHEFHHQNPKEAKFGTLDFGWWFIRLIRK